MAKTIAIVTPVLDDWASFAELMTEISDRFTGSGVVFHICAVDDGSAAPFDAADILLPTVSCVESIEIIRLAANLGHQRAIAIGLCAIADSSEIDAAVVMDSDGQDRPADISALLAASARHPRSRRVRRAGTACRIPRLPVVVSALQAAVSCADRSSDRFRQLLFDAGVRGPPSRAYARIVESTLRPRLCAPGFPI